MGITKDGYYPVPNANKELHKVYYCAYVTNGNETLFYGQYIELSNKISKSVTKELRHYNIKHKKVYPPERGGGGDFLRELFRNLNEFKDFYLLGVKIILWLVRQIKLKVAQHKEKKLGEQKLKGIVMLNLRESNAFDERQSPEIGKLALHLLELGVIITKRLHKDFPLIQFDIESEIEIKPIDYVATFKLSPKTSNQYRIDKVLSKASKIKPKQGVHQFIHD